MAAAAPISVARTEPGPPITTVAEGPDWVSLEYRRDILPGSALDFSGLGIHDAPAGKRGWLVSRNGHAEFEKRPGVPARFYGVNLCSTANYLSNDEIERVTDRLVRLGYNAVRIHHHDGAWAKAHARRRNVESPLRGSLKNVEAPLRGSLKNVETPSTPSTSSTSSTPSTPSTSVDVVDDDIDRLDYLLAKCFERGIYVTTDLYVSRQCTWRELGIDRDGDADMQSAKLLMMVTDAGFENWKRFARDFLTHVNPYTGRSLAEEPAMPLIVLINESSPHSDWDKAKSLPEFRALWPQWLAEARAENPRAFPTASPETFPETGGWWDPSPENSPKAAFWSWVCGRFSERAAAFLRDELGVKALLATENNGPILPQILKMRADLGGYVDFHYYTEHAASASKAAREETGLPLHGVFRNHNPLQDPRGMYRAVAFNRVWGRPLVVSESQMGGPNFNRAMAGLLTGAFAAIQDWTGIWTFAYAHNREKLFDGIDSAPGRFDLSLDPLMQATDRLPILLFLRGDQATPEAAFTNAFTDAAMRADAEGRVSLSSRPQWAGRGLEWCARLGVAFEERGRDVSTKRPLRGGGRAVGASLPENDEAYPAGEPPALPECGVTVDSDKGSIIVAGPRTCGAFVQAGDSFEAGALSASVRGHSALVVATALDGSGLADASRILVWHLTDLHGEGFSWGGDIAKSSYWRQTGILDWGSSRLMLHAGEAEVALKLDCGGTEPAAQNSDRSIVSPAPSGDVRVFALDTAGNRRAEVPAVLEAARSERSPYQTLRFTASSRQPFGGCLYYEIVRK